MDNTNNKCRFTFQYGSTYIENKPQVIHIDYMIYIPIWFYLYIQIDIIINVQEIFTFQYGSTYIFSTFLVLFLFF